MPYPPHKRASHEQDTVGNRSANDLVGSVQPPTKPADTDQARTRNAQARSSNLLSGSGGGGRARAGGPLSNGPSTRSGKRAANAIAAQPPDDPPTKTTFLNARS